MANLAQAVGDHGVNADADVRTVQALLNAQAVALGITPLAVDGKPSAALVEAIKRLQTRVMLQATADGRIDPAGRTWRVLSGAEPADLASRLSGAAWWHANEARYGNSADLAALEPGFAAKARAFVAALRLAGATVQVSATRRHKVRAYLMHFSWRIANGSVKAADAPAEPGCTIVWDHRNDADSRRAAQQMVNLFQIVFQPSLTSQHIAGLAVDMTIGWAGTLTLPDAAGKPVALSTAPRDGSHPALHKVGASYGVIKLLSDPPHWSVDGH